MTINNTEHNNYNLCLILGLWTVSLIPWFWSAVHLDIARDIMNADVISNGELVTRGPIIGGLFYLSPYWFYILSVPLVFDSNWLIEILFIGVLSGLKFPLAYVFFIGNGNRKAALIVCFLLFLFGWIHHQWLLPTHTVMVPSATIALLILFQRLCFTKNSMRLFLGGVFFGLCFHSHPTILPLGALIFWSANKNNLSSVAYVKYILSFALGAGLTVLPILFLSQGGNVEYSTSTFIDYLGNLPILESIYKIPYVFKEVIWGEFGYITKVDNITLGYFDGLVRYMYIVVILFLIFAVMKYTKEACKKLPQICFILPLMVVFVTLIRAQLPFYMIWAASTILIVFLAQILSFVKNKWIIRYIKLTSLMVWGYLGGILVYNQSMGSTYLDLNRIFGYSSDNKFVESIYMISAWERDKISEVVCSSKNYAIHGPIINNIIFDYNIGEKLYCPNKNISLSGAINLNHITFMPKWMINEIRISNVDMIGGVGYKKSTPLHPKKKLSLDKSVINYIPKYKGMNEKKKIVLKTPLKCDESLVIANGFQYMSIPPSINVKAKQDSVLELKVKNMNTQIYGCIKESGNAVNVKIVLSGYGVNGIDISIVKN